MFASPFSSGGAQNARHACAGAGRWFPADPARLRAEVREYLAQADQAATPPSPQTPPGRVLAIIVPHAGYRYSGPTAAKSFAALRANKSVKRVVILAFSHSYPVPSLSTLNVEAYETPLGSIPVDRLAVAELLKDPLFKEIPRAHQTEHSDENQLPFLQEVLGKDFKMVSVFVGGLKAMDFDRAAALLKTFADEHTVFVVSSDFTHYGEDYGFAPFRDGGVKQKMRALDRGAIDRILARDFDGFRGYINETGATICGVQPISLLLKILPPGAKGTLLGYETSADRSGGDYSMAVGYAAIAFTAPEKADDLSRKNGKIANSAEALSREMGIPFVNLRDYDLSDTVKLKRMLSYIPPQVARGRRLFPLDEKEENLGGRILRVLTVAIADPLDIRIQDDLRSIIPDHEIQLVVCEEDDILRSINHYYGSSEAKQDHSNMNSSKSQDSATSSFHAAKAAQPVINPEGPAKALINLDLVSPAERKTLLRLARATLEHSFSSKRKEKFDVSGLDITENLKKKNGVFVTLKIQGELRGCIGHIVGREPLWQGVRDNALNAAYHDPRFPTLTADELKKVDIEISVLSPLVDTRPEDVVVGRDGLLISLGGYSGVLLPQVPVEWGWTRSEFLEHLCRKAGLPKGSWREAELQSFGAQVFGEKE